MSEPRRKHNPSWPGWTGGTALLKPVRNILSLIVPDEPPLELQIVGRTLLHAALVGLVAGLVGSGFMWALERVQVVLMEWLCGYAPLRAHGELTEHIAEGTPFRWYLLALLPAIGGLISGYLVKFSPEARGGGGDAAIDAFHHKNGVIDPNVLWVKPVASIACLGTGGSGGREGPTMQIGAAFGSIVGKYLAVTTRERRTLMVAGIAAGISAVFRTPLGAALLAIEMLYRDDFESDALIPCVLASVIAYAVALAVFGFEPLFGNLPRYPFHAGQMPLFLGLALVISLGAVLFEKTMHQCNRLFARVRGPEWIRPALGGLVLGIFAVVLLLTLDPWIGNGNRGLGIFGGGYGAGQLAIDPAGVKGGGAAWLSPGWTTVELLLTLAIAKIVATSLTIGSGGSAGDFAPSLAIGGLLGGAFGWAAQLLLHDPSIQPGAFALVGMAAFYAGIGKTPLAALVIVSEVAGSYDLLVPLMLTEAVAMIMLRKISLYRSQPRTTKDSPVHARLLALRCGDVVAKDRPVATLRRNDSIHVAADAIESAPDQDVFPVVDDTGKVHGLLAAEQLRSFVSDGAAIDVAIVADAMQKAVVFNLRDDVRTAALTMVRDDLRAAPVLDDTGRIIGMLDLQDIVRTLTAATAGSGEDSMVRRTY